MKYKTKLFIFLSLCGSLLYTGGAEWVLAFTPVYILFSLAILFRRSHIFTPRIRNILVGIGLIGFISEVVGVQTGYLYGSYTYGTVLGPKLFGVALMLFVMWIFVPLATYSAVNIKSRYTPYLAGVLAVGYDIVLEKFAIENKLWEWEGNTVPFLNYATWFVVSSALVGVLMYKKIPISNPVSARVVLCTHILFFSILILI